MNAINNVSSGKNLTENSDNGTVNINYKPIFSVVMPMYNVEKYVYQAITSVLEQSYPLLELICVDDGCTDNTVSIVNRFSDSRIRLIQQSNRGLSGARNTGINCAQGLYVAFLDSDDFWHADKLLEHLKHFYSDSDISVSYSASAFVNEYGQNMGIGQYPKTEHITAKDIFCRNPIGNGSAPIFKKSLLMQVGKPVVTESGTRIQYFDESMRQSEDVEFWLRVKLSTDAKFAGINKALTYYRVNMGGLSANLENQYQAWHYSVTKNKAINPEFFKRWSTLACAYQLRYLSRRAVQSGNRWGAIKLIHLAMLKNIRILIEEPIRTTVTYSCCLLNLLPKGLYLSLEKSAMSLSKNFKSA